MHNNRPRKYRNLKVRYEIEERAFGLHPRFLIYTAEYFDGIFRFLQSFDSHEEAQKAGEWYAKTREITS